jgi:bisphosphoglycerate-independent phosphoglycerate mutase (AlkP superfamily)
LKASLNDLKISHLSETATDLEIEAAWQDLCKLQKELRENQKILNRQVKKRYDEYDSQKRERIEKACKVINPNEGNEMAIEEKCKEVMNRLAAQKESLIADRDLLLGVVLWP